MKISHIFPFLEKSELEGEFMKFADKLSEDIVVVAFQSLNQENGKMQKGNKMQCYTYLDFAMQNP